MNNILRWIGKILIISVLYIGMLHSTYAIDPLVTVVELNMGERIEVQLSDGSKHVLQALDMRVSKDALTNAVRETIVILSINNQKIFLPSGGYHLPLALDGLQIECPVTKALAGTTDRNAWRLEKDIRLRLWPENSPWITPGTFKYPLEQELFDNYTQMANTPVGPGTVPGRDRVYYHSGLDFGGVEGVNVVRSATDGYIVVVGEDKLDSLPPRVSSRYDAVYVRDNRGWYYRYSHLKEIDPKLKPGEKIKMGQKIGIMGKEGASGGYAHLHFAISSKMPSGQWANQGAFPFIWQAYLEEYKPKVLAIARPDIIAFVGEEVRLDGTRSWSIEKGINSFEWTFFDGTRSNQPVTTTTYPEPGFYSEILRVIDSNGNTDYDFAMVQVYDRDLEKTLPFVHVAHYPSQDIKVGDEITFNVRTLRVQSIEEIWDFGDGSKAQKTKSINGEQLDPDGYATLKHTYRKPGDYIVTVNSRNDSGILGVARVHVHVKK